MKGTPESPQCGFSKAVIDVLTLQGVPFNHCDILENTDIRQGIKEYTDWPTVPQVFIKGEFVGFVGRHPDTGFGHSSSDTPDKVRIRELKEYAGLLARLLLRLSHTEPSAWPENRLDTAVIQKRLNAERGSVLRTM